MTPLATYAAFLAARWDEIEHEHRTGYVRSPYVLADLAAKRGILEVAMFADERRAESRTSAAFASAYEHVLRALTHSFHAHPDYPANADA